MSRFYAPPEAFSGSKITISGQEARHIADVMRLRKGDNVVVFDGTGRECDGVIVSVWGGVVEIGVTGTRQVVLTGGIAITLIQAIPKREKMDYIVEKATELGVASIIPVMTKRTIPDWNADKKEKQAERWRSLALEASKQCGRADLPVITGIVDLRGAVTHVASYDVKVIAALAVGTIPLKKALPPAITRAACAIGPEGDFTADEIALARDAGFKPVSLGRRVLKSDTAGLYVIAALQHHFSE